MTMLHRSRLRLGWVVVGAALFAAGCATGPGKEPKAKAGGLTEKLGLYRGEDLDNLRGLTFDGERFKASGIEPIARNDVQVVQFQRTDKQGAAKGQEAAAALSPLAQSLLERGQALAQQYPGVGGVILVDDGEFVLNADKTWRYRYHFAGLVLKDEMKAWAQVSYGFTEGRSRVQVLFARSVNADGTVNTLSPDALQVGSPSEDLEFFNPNQKTLSGVIPGVDVGSVVEYSYEYENYDPEDWRLFSPGYYFQSTEPVVLSRIRAQVPKDVPFHYVTRHFSQGQQKEPAVEETRDARAYTWTVEDVAPLSPEPYMPPEHDVVPMMEASVFKDFQEAYDLVAGLQRPRMQLTPEISAKVAEITQGAETVDDKLARLYHWVQENTRYISIKGSLGSGMSGHTAQETFENRYGDCTDKAILFATMGQAVGATCYPIILTTNDAGTGITEIPTVGGNHAITKVELGDRKFYLDTTAQNYRYPYFRADDHGAFAVNAIKGEIEPIPVPPPSDNQRASHLDVALDANGNVTVRTKNAYTGNVEAGVRGFWKRTREDNRKAMMSDYVNSISPGALLDDFTLSDLDDLSCPLNMTLDYRLPGHAIRARDLMYLRMPTLERDYPEVALETRKYPIQYATTEERILDIDLKLPPKFHAKWCPPPLEFKSVYLDYRAAYEEEKGKIVFRETYRRLARVVPPEDYAGYRDALRAIAEFSKKEIFVTEGN